jgi:ADP-heptose:LPS heptosyltransferase
MIDRSNISDHPSPSAKVRYVILLFMTECLRGSAIERRRFIGRITRRLARLLGLYQVSYLAFRIWQKIVGSFQTPLNSTGGPRFPRWLWATGGLDNSDHLRSWIKRRYEGGPKIVVLGTGSIGDVLQITPLLRALREKFPAAEISLLHRSQAVRTVLQGNRNIDSISIADSYQFEQVKKAVREEGGADLVVEIEGISCIVTYIPAPLALRHHELGAVFPESFFAAAAAAQKLCKRHHPVFPYREVKDVRSEEAKDIHYLDVLGATSNLPVDRHSALDFFPEAEDAGVLDLFAPKKPYVTVQNGVDRDVMKWSRVMGQRPTKLLPASTWQETVRLLQAGNLAVIQLGTKDDERIEGVDMDLRDCTTLGQAAVILKSAVCHVGIEGGLVHLARAVGVRSVVAFGPTSSAFLGYPQNANLVASDCNNCWWTTKDWHTYCPRGLAGPPCMNAHTADVIAKVVLSIHRGDEVHC